MQIEINMNEAIAILDLIKVAYEEEIDFPQEVYEVQEKILGAAQKVIDRHDNANKE